MERSPARWPTANQLVELRAGPSLWLPSRVEDREEGRIVVAAPSAGRGEPVLVERGDRAALRWFDARGLGTLDATVTGAQRHPVPVWVLEAVDLPTLIQRRRFARVPFMVPVRVAGRRPYRLVSLDLAEGGMLCIAPAPWSFEPGERLQLFFEVDGLSVQSSAWVVRCQLTPGGAMVALAFIDLPRGDADRLRRFVYHRQVHLAVTGRS